MRGECFVFNFELVQHVSLLLGQLYLLVKLVHLTLLKLLVLDISQNLGSFFLLEVRDVIDLYVFPRLVFKLFLVRQNVVYSSGGHCTEELPYFLLCVVTIDTCSLLATVIGVIGFLGLVFVLQPLIR